MIVAIALVGFAAVPAEAFGHHRGGGCCGGGYGGCYGGCYGGGWYGGCCGGGWYGGWGGGCCGGGWYGGGYAWSGPGYYGSGSRLAYDYPYQGNYSYGYYGATNGNNGQGGSPATVEIRVPQPDAQVWFDDHLTRQTGAVRTYETPALTNGSYTVRVRWNENGQPMEQTQQLAVRGGQTQNLDFTGAERGGIGTGNNERGGADRGNLDRGGTDKGGTDRGTQGSPNKGSQGGTDR
jgi:uncharacterized protein (TIGR03000 family)